ncbi:DUF1127 domain-containing protein [Mesorhizobium sp. M4B.F.Ca.ET.190.01.1.1]|uniref:DUF1127 domain-containing protein n=1 Tax=unclassified Mesorhizobium TaxID=325217 RepID=UPI000FE528A8|nr:MULTISPECIES: DUF1127 domain-containing protein [unclassified Mesorhizobium]RWA58762.1 MAG: DUF1127 domain-containing protein [Mesorhizobium sp.]RWF63885.1 MAG: DUF1127 domain-containing protein [Mesorhizobium sp.]TGR00791.1 DUF1127 domain-containing protein [Mesorhizobium sp. M4B.F.Ca.ET.200.01.1.1]TGS12568.1 DUF1127 domain-containing protein [Mesorhizobium sp. M4B.F.Ca.ET.190.01.1.1]TGT24800.1 DUF1127 domain-containing protein [Mesorhizobium sp. M4B.F.Ca.ET.172.01.1.1]
MSSLEELEFTVDRPFGWRFFVTAIDRFGVGAFARIIRIRRDRARLHEFPDHLLRDIGIDRSEIALVTRYGSRDGRGWLWN